MASDDSTRMVFHHDVKTRVTTTMLSRSHVSTPASYMIQHLSWAVYHRRPEKAFISTTLMSELVLKFSQANRIVELKFFEAMEVIVDQLVTTQVAG